MELSARIERLQEKLEQLKRLDRNLSVYGARYHQYRFNGCLTFEQLTAVEQDYQISFPEEYQAFLLKMGNGGAGPGQGVFSLEESFKEIAAELQDDRAFLTYPFVAPASPNELPPLLEEHIDLYFYAPGTFPVGHAGDSIMQSLILNGPERGNIWNHRDDWFPCPPHEKSSRLTTEEWKNLKRFDHYPYRATFFDWYEIWLDNEREKRSS
jgi:SMI1 / KNR4 family (SUKH-1)